MENFVTDTTAIARQFKMQHAKVVAALTTLSQKIMSIPEDDPFYFLTTDFVSKPIQKEYKGTRFTAYLLTKGMAILLSSRFKTMAAIEYMMGVISGNEMFSQKVKEIASGGGTLEEMGRSLILLQRLDLSDRVQRERLFVDEVVQNFSDIFPDFKFVGREAVTDEGDKIDILAEEKGTGRPVIIEAKIDNTPVHKQLRSYAYNFKDPILVGISPVPIFTQTEDIRYYTFGGQLPTDQPNQLTGGKDDN